MAVEELAQRLSPGQGDLTSPSHVEKKYNQFFPPELTWLAKIPAHFIDLFLFREVKAVKLDYGSNQTNVDQEVKKITKLAFHVLDDDLFEGYQGPLSAEKYLKIRESIKHFYLLTAPCSDPDGNAQIIKAEQVTDQDHIGRDVMVGQRVWLAHEQNPRAFSSVAADSLDDEEKAEADRWFLANDGLLDHTFIAAENIINLILAIQANIKNNSPAEQMNELQKKFLLIDPYLYGVKMLFHDLGRLITQDRLVHELETQNILMRAGVQLTWREEPAYVPLLNMQGTQSIFAMVGQEKDFMRFIFYLADFTSKVKSDSGELRRPADFLQIIQKQSQRYAGSESSTARPDSKIITQNQIFHLDDYGILEGIILTKVLHWLQDNERGLGFSREQLEEVYLQTEARILGIREELGLV